MTPKLLAALQTIVKVVDGAVGGMSKAAAATQQQCFEAVRKALFSLDTSNGRLVQEQDYSTRLLQLERYMQALTRNGLARPLKDYLGVFSDIETRNVAMQKTYSDLEVDVKKLSPARQFVLETANRYLGSAGIADRFIQPAKYLLMQQVATGASITEAQKMLERWNEGLLTDGKQTAGRQTPNLQRYITQMARDTAYQYNGTIQGIIREEYGLTHFIYTGDVITDTRPLCRHLIEAEQPIAFADLPALLNAYPQGVISGTGAQNFQVYRGGYNCRHVVYPVNPGKSVKGAKPTKAKDPEVEKEEQRKEPLKTHPFKGTKEFSRAMIEELNLDGKGVSAEVKSTISSWSYNSDNIRKKAESSPEYQWWQTAVTEGNSGHKEIYRGLPFAKVLPHKVAEFEDLKNIFQKGKTLNFGDAAKVNREDWDLSLLSGSRAEAVAEKWAEVRDPSYHSVLFTVKRASGVRGIRIEQLSEFPNEKEIVFGDSHDYFVEDAVLKNGNLKVTLVQR